MLIDSHCHIDLYPSPEQAIRDAEAEGVCVVAVTNLPSHYLLARDKLLTSPHVRPALGIHPLHAAAGLRELALFRRLASQADLIGEIGLDFSPEGAAKKAIQERVFNEVLAAISDRPRFITVHSRGAVKAVVNALDVHRVRGAVFHWFTGSQADMRAILDAGHVFSINPAMLKSQAGTRLLDYAPPEAILAETDGPFARFDGRPVAPADTAIVYRAIAHRLNKTIDEACRIVTENCRRHGLSFSVA